MSGKNRHGQRGANKQGSTEKRGRTVRLQRMGPFRGRFFALAYRIALPAPQSVVAALLL
jgi:hypothetical protein